MSIFQKHQLYINGIWCQSKTTFPVTNPATLTKLADVADACESDALNAIAAADSAFASWQNTTPKDRSRLLRKWFDLVSSIRMN